MSKQQKTTQTTTPSQFTQQSQQAAWNQTQAGLQGGIPGIQAPTNQALSGYQGAQAGGNLGIGALSGNQQDVSALMSPYMNNVIGQMQNQFGQTSQAVNAATNANSTMQGAFGGDRAGVAAGAAQANLGAQNNAQIAGLLQSGYQGAMGQASNLANLGMGANAGLQGIGAYQQQILQNQQLLPGQILTGTSQALAPGSGGTSTQTASQNPFNALLGAGLGIGGLMMPNGISGLMNPQQQPTIGGDTGL